MKCKEHLLSTYCVLMFGEVLLLQGVLVMDLAVELEEKYIHMCGTARCTVKYVWVYRAHEMQVDYIKEPKEISVRKKSYQMESVAGSVMEKDLDRGFVSIFYLSLVDLFPRK